MADFEPGTALPELRVLPEVETTDRYAAASGDHNPIHLDAAFAQSVGLPGRILHGLWTMAQVARAQTAAAGRPDALRRLDANFRGMGLPGAEITVTGTVVEVRDEVAVVRADAVQNGKKIIKNAEAEVRLR